MWKCFILTFCTLSSEDFFGSGKIQDSTGYIFASEINVFGSDYSSHLASKAAGFFIRVRGVGERGHLDYFDFTIGATAHLWPTARTLSVEKSTR